VQIACFDSNSALLDSVDILKGIAEPGVYEFPLSAYRSVFPPQTKEISPRLWVGGKAGAEAVYRSVALAVADNAVVPPVDRSIEKYTRATAGTWNIKGEPPFVLAHYVDWFSTDRTATAGGGQSWDHWSRGGAHGHDASKRGADGLRDVASILYPLIGPYDSNSRAVVRYHLATMRAAGISGLIIDWYGKGSDSDQCMPTILDEAQKLDMKVAICFEEKIPCVWSNPKSRGEILGNAVRDLTYAINTWTKHPAYLKRDGRPFFMQFNSWGTNKLGPAHLTPDEDRELFNKLPEKIAFCRQNADTNFFPPVQAAYTWWSEGDRPRQFAQTAAQLRDQGKLEFFMSMLCVGFNDTGVWGWGDGPRVSKSYGLPVLQKTESMALDEGPELIQCVTWNDFNEGTCFEPTLQHGFAWVDEVEKFVNKIHGRPVDLEDNRKPFEEYQRSCSQAEQEEIPKFDPKLLQP
jgi:hypothetical protein